MPKHPPAVYDLECVLCSIEEVLEHDLHVDPVVEGCDLCWLDAPLSPPELAALDCIERVDCVPWP